MQDREHSFVVLNLVIPDKVFIDIPAKYTLALR